MNATTTAAPPRRRAAADEKAQLTFALQQYAVSDAALRRTITQLQAELAKERSGKVATGILAGLAGLFVGGMAGGGDAE